VEKLSAFSFQLSAFRSAILLTADS